MARPRGGLKHFFFKPALPGRGVTDTDKISFYAHITSVTDDSNPNWEESYDMGRPDPKMFYRSFSRSMNLSFIIIALDKDEQKLNYDNMRRLSLLTYPMFSGGKGYTAPHVQYRIGDLFQGYGVITSIGYSWDDGTVWVDDKPILTPVTLAIKVLGDGSGNRPSYNDGKYNYFGV